MRTATPFARSSPSLGLSKTVRGKAGAIQQYNLSGLCMNFAEMLNENSPEHNSAILVLVQQFQQQSSLRQTEQPSVDDCPSHIPMQVKTPQINQRGGAMPQARRRRVG